MGEPSATAEVRTAKVLWYGMFASPVIWSAHMLTGYFVSEAACMTQMLGFTIWGISALLVFLVAITLLAMGGIPTYPTLADGVSPICPFEEPAADLAQRLLQRRIYAAELIPVRNTVACVDAYVHAFTQAGLIVMAGTEHNTPERIPLEAACVDGPLSDAARQAFWEGTCVVAAHQSLVKNGEAGYVDDAGDPVGGDVVARRNELVKLGAALIASGQETQGADR